MNFGLVFEIIFGIVPAVFVLIVIFAAIKANKNQKKTKNNEEFKDIYEKIERETKSLDNPNLTDKEIEEELTRRFNAMSQNKNSSPNPSSSHDNTCLDNSCDGCGGNDVYNQIYGKRKKNKLKK